MYSTVLYPVGQTFALIDADDVLLVGGRKWYLTRRDGYAWTVIDSKPISMHRMIMGKSLSHIDHWNGNRLDNRRCNLRFVNSSQNQHNRKAQESMNGKPVTSLYKGVSSSGRKWRTWICADKQSIYCGSFETQEDAALAYNIKAKELHGQFARINEGLVFTEEDINRVIGIIASKKRRSKIGSNGDYLDCDCIA